jgi:hypothetical protein
MCRQRLPHREKSPPGRPFPDRKIVTPATDSVKLRRMAAEMNAESAGHNSARINPLEDCPPGTVLVFMDVEGNLRRYRLNWRIYEPPSKIRTVGFVCARRLFLRSRLPPEDDPHPSDCQCRCGGRPGPGASGSGAGPGSGEYGAIGAFLHNRGPTTTRRGKSGEGLESPCM